MTFRIHIPAPSSMLVANLMSAIGLITAVIAVGGLAGVWWAVLAGGLVLVGLGVIATINALGETETAAVHEPPPASVPRSAAARAV